MACFSGRGLFLLASSRRLRRVATAMLLSVAESMGMTVVGAPEALRRPAAGGAPAVPGAAQP